MNKNFTVVFNSSLWEISFLDFLIVGY